MQIEIHKLFWLLNMDYIITNSADPDEMLHVAVPSSIPCACKSGEKCV